MSEITTCVCVCVCVCLTQSPLKSPFYEHDEEGLNTTTIKLFWNFESLRWVLFKPTTCYLYM